MGGLRGGWLVTGRWTGDSFPLVLLLPILFVLTQSMAVGVSILLYGLHSVLVSFVFVCIYVVFDFTFVDYFFFFFSIHNAMHNCQIFTFSNEAMLYFFNIYEKFFGT